MGLPCLLIELSNKALANYKKNIIVLGFVAFSVSNLIAMYQNMVHFNVVLDSIQAATFKGSDINFKSIFENYHHKAVWRVACFQVVATALLSYVLLREEN